MKPRRRRNAGRDSRSVDHDLSDFVLYAPGKAARYRAACSRASPHVLIAQPVTGQARSWRSSECSSRAPRQALEDLAEQPWSGPSARQALRLGDRRTDAVMDDSTTATVSDEGPPTIGVEGPHPRVERETMSQATRSTASTIGVKMHRDSSKDRAGLLVHRLHPGCAGAAGDPNLPGRNLGSHDARQQSSDRRTPRQTARRDSEWLGKQGDIKVWRLPEIWRSKRNSKIHDVLVREQKVAKSAA